MYFISKIGQAIFGTKNDRELNKLQPIIANINALEDTYSALDDAALREKTQSFKDAYTSGQTLDDLLPDAFAAVREASKRTLGLRHYDVQMISGIALHKGWIAEAKTGEGKTLTATLPSFLNALTGNGVHIIVPNAYLAKRDANWVKPIFDFLGLSVAIAENDSAFLDRQSAYRADITYTTNHTLGFDYLRDNMRTSNEHRCLKDFAYCIIDEADSILIDEARTPLIITGQAADSSALYQHIYQLTAQLQHSEDNPQDVIILHKEKQAHLTESGHDKMNELLHKTKLIAEGSDLYEVENIRITHYINACLKARFLFHKDIDYVIDQEQVVIIDESTGRKSIGRRWSDGIHQALEAKEKLPVQKENQTLASITYQNLFRLYPKISGMTGTADTEATELKDIYQLNVLVVPTNRPMVRTDHADQIYLNEEDKLAAIMKEVQTRHEKGQPILIGTTSIESSELLSKHLKNIKIKHNVLNAKHHEREADIIAEAGRLGSVTIATNMAGRGTDIILGGDPKENKHWKEEHKKVIESGGLHVLGSERHESRRIDNQLRGRSGRQGDVGSSQFYLSLDDKLMKRFASEQMKYFMQVFGMKKGENLSAPMLNRSIANAQHNIEAHYYDMRKNLLQLDNVANDQRSIIYQQRNELLVTDSISDVIDDMTAQVAQQMLTQIKQGITSFDEKSCAQIQKSVKSQLKIDITVSSNTTIEDLLEILKKQLMAHIIKQREQFGDAFIQLEKQCLLSILDRSWKEHLAAMDHLRMGIQLRRYAQKNPTHEFKAEALQLFDQLLAKVKYATIHALANIEPQKPTMQSSGGYTITVNNNYEENTN
ncbi:preprotein translocase subunit SecA [Gammaproteobacteria bacterium]|nr:preprotein translocase subunit SecA [Gammaproteobacteria bacterium]